MLLRALHLTVLLFLFSSPFFARDFLITKAGEILEGTFTEQTTDNISLKLGSTGEIRRLPVIDIKGTISTDKDLIITTDGTPYEGDIVEQKPKGTVIRAKSDGKNYEIPREMIRQTFSRTITDNLNLNQAPAIAENTSWKKRYIGPIFGPAFTVSGGNGTYLAYGIRVGTDLGEDRSGTFTLGLNVSRGSDSQTISGIVINQSLTMILAELISRRMFGTPLYGGARAGIGLLNATISDASTSINGSSSPFVFGPVLGYELAMAGKYSVTFDLSWITRGSGTLSFPGVGIINYNSASAVLVQIGGNLLF